MRPILLLLLLVGCCCASSTAVAEDDRPDHATAAGNFPTQVAPRTVVEVPDFRIDRDLRSALVEGLAVTFGRAAGKTFSDTRNSRLAALYVTPDDAASAFLNPGPFTATFDGFLKLKLKTECTLSLAGRGQARLYINQTPVLTATGDDFSAAGAVTVALGKYNLLRLEYTSPAAGPAGVQLYWQSDEFSLEQVPPTALYCDGSNANLLAGERLRVGRGLLANHLCLKCHAMTEVPPLGGQGMPELAKQAPSLVAAGERFEMPWLVQWILDPHAVRNKVTMPGLFPDPGSEAARREAADIAAYVVSLTAAGPDTPPKAVALTGNEGDGKLGEQLYEDLGCIACHRISGSAEEDTLNRVSLRHAALKLKPGALAAFLQDPRRHYAWSRMPDFRLTAAEAAALEAYIRATADGDLDGFQPLPKVSAELGRIGFQARGCANCHDTGDKQLDIKRSGPAIDRTVPQKGCLVENAGDRGNAPFFGFSEDERAALTEFLTTDRDSLRNNVPAEAARRQIQSLNCVACHRMDSFDSDLALAIEEYGSGKPQDDLMPILTFAGERLYSAWTEKLFAGQRADRSRSWLKTRMPAFSTRAKTLAHGLAAQHGFAPTQQPPFVVDPKKAEIGYRLTVKDGGFDCVQCHGIGDQPPTATFDARGVNFAISTERLRHEYYQRWMLNPQRFDPTTKMPRFSADGIKTSLEHVYDGDAAKQFDALWHYVQSLDTKLDTAASKKMNLNQRSFEIYREMARRAAELRIAHQKLPCGSVLIDCGADVGGGLEAGRSLAECCLAGLGRVAFVTANRDMWPGPAVQVYTDQPVAACMAAQYAGWEIKVDDYFAMGSGPMRAAANKEPLFEKIGYAERPEVAVGILETRQPPTGRVATHLADQCGVDPSNLVLLFAPTASQAGNVQIVARSVETTMHKLFELGFDLDRVESGFGVAPLPPVAADDLAGIGRTNDAILYGAEVTLWVRGDDASLEAIGPRVPSNSSSDHGQPFATIFARYDHDFYKIDRHLFSPAVVTVINLDTGRWSRFGELAADLIRESFAS